jgi:hypothetical protein
MKNAFIFLALVTICSSMFPYKPCNPTISIKHYKKGTLVKKESTKSWYSINNLHMNKTDADSVVTELIK